MTRRAARACPPTRRKSHKMCQRLMPPFCLPFCLEVTSFMTMWDVWPLPRPWKVCCRALYIVPSVLLIISFGESLLVGDSPKVSKETARVIQKRRVTRLAFKLAEKLQGWVDQDYDLCKTCWETEAAELAKASFGFEMVTTIGKVRISIQ